MIIAEIKGKQYAIEAGKDVTVDRIDEPQGTAFKDIKVLYYNDGGDILVGKPYLENIKVQAFVEEQTRGDKVRSIRYRRRTGLRKVKGHRQDYTILKVDKIDKT